jgi:hypothetical protein
VADREQPGRDERAGREPRARGVGGAPVRDRARVPGEALRIVITRVSLAAAFSSFATLAQVDVFKVLGSVFSPAPATLFTVDGSTLVVDAEGHVGVGQPSPSAPLHFGGLDSAAAGADARGARAVVLLDSAAAAAAAADPADAAFAYRGWALAPDALVQRVESSAADHAFAAGPTELVRITGAGRVGVLTAAPTCALDVAGSAAVRQALAVGSNLALASGSATLLGGHSATACVGGPSPACASSARGTVAVVVPRSPHVAYVKLATVCGSTASFRVAGTVCAGADRQSFDALLS